jgi:hypothetical protein
LLDLLRSYLVKLPAPTTSPLYLQVNTSQVLAALSSNGSVTEVPCFSTSPDAEQLPLNYVVVREALNFSGQWQSRQYQHGSRQSSLGLEIEVNANGSNDTEAEGRAEMLIQEIDIFLTNNRSLILNGTNSIVRNPVNPGETNKFDKIANFFPPIRQNQRNITSGPGTDKNKPQWQCKRFLMCEVVVYRGR